jgi:hypothetical protein
MVRELDVVAIDLSVMEAKVCAVVRELGIVGIDLSAV